MYEGKMRGDEGDGEGGGYEGDESGAGYEGWGRLWRCFKSSQISSSVSLCLLKDDSEFATSRATVFLPAPTFPTTTTHHSNKLFPPNHAQQLPSNEETESGCPYSIQEGCRPTCRGDVVTSPQSSGNL